MSQIASNIFYLPGSRKDLLIGAPHHGYIRGSDYFTKEFAQRLASQLGSPLIYADGLRPLVDLNKDPERASTPELKELCQIYQDHATAAPVELFMEVHGHINGHYDLEISCGFELDKQNPLDLELGKSLAELEGSLDQELTQNWNEEFRLPRPTLGIFPPDQRVVMKATQTHLFQKIREMQLAGRRIFGIHIEIYKNYRTNSPSSPAYPCQEAVVDSLAKSIRQAFLRD